MTINAAYRTQVDLLIEIMGPVLADERLALKGGTAINLFFSNLPRLSVDLDLVYLPLAKRETFLKDLEEIFGNIKEQLALFKPQIFRTQDGIPKQIRVQKRDAKVKVEINLVLRGTVFSPQERDLCSKAQTIFEKSVSVRCGSFEDIYAGKFCAALDRQHPRDLFDVMLFLETIPLQKS